ncbi:hypothetical protein HG531_001849 [Fusarium graminearum]|nr:hypothetical protein HG531_001849 [Fusarium graminearum]
MHLGGSDELVTRSKNLVNLGYTLSTIGKSSDSLGTSSQNNALSTNLVGDVDDLRGNAAIGTRRRSKDNLLAASDHGWHTKH